MHAQPFRFASWRSWYACVTIYILSIVALVTVASFSVLVPVSHADVPSCEETDCDAGDSTDALCALLESQGIDFSAFPWSTICDDSSDEEDDASEGSSSSSFDFDQGTDDFCDLLENHGIDLSQFPWDSICSDSSNDGSSSDGSGGGSDGSNGSNGSAGSEGNGGGSSDGSGGEGSASSGGSGSEGSESSGGGSSDGASSAGSQVSMGSSGSAGSETSGGSGTSTAGGNGGGELSITGLSLPSVGNDSGSYRGWRLNVTRGVVRFLASIHLGHIAPGGFGGGRAPLTSAERNYLCSVQRGLLKDATQGYLEHLVSVILQFVKRPALVVEKNLRDQDLCRDLTAMLRPQESLVSYAAQPVYVATDGMPYSKVDADWNACIRGTAKPLAGVDCAAYHTGSMWRYPDLSIYITFVRPNKVREMILEIPEGYVLYEDQKLVVMN